jgi:hypothetical protein
VKQVERSIKITATKLFRTQNPIPLFGEDFMLIMIPRTALSLGKPAPMYLIGRAIDIPPLRGSAATYFIIKN